MRRLVAAICTGMLVSCGGGGADAPPPPPVSSLSLFAGNLGGSGSADGPLAVARFDSPWGMAVDASGAIHVGDSGNHVVRRISSQGQVSTLAGRAGTRGYANGTGADARFDYPRALVADAAGIVYVSDSGNRAIRSITPTGRVATVLEGIDARGLALDREGNLLASDAHSIVRITPAGVKSIVAGVPGECATLDGPRETARLCSPTGLEADTDGNIHFVGLDHTVRRIGPAGDVVTLAGAAQRPGVQDGNGSGARFAYPWGIARDAAGNLYVTSDHAVRRVTPAGEVTTLAGRAGQPGNANGEGGAARFAYLWDVMALPGGDLLVSDSLNHTLRRITPSGMVTAYAGSPPAGARMAADVAVAPDGTVYSIGQRAVNRITRDGVVSVLAGIEDPAGGGQLDGIGAAARFDQLNGIAVDASGNIHVSDVTSPAFPFAASGTKIPPPVYWGTIRRITPAGEVTTIAGSASAGGNIDGVGRAARFRNLRGLAIDPAGTIYVGDSDARTIRRIAPGAVVTTLAGRDMVFGGEDGAGSGATFGSPEGIAVDAQGNVFVADAGNATIRKVTPEGVVTTFAGAAGGIGQTLDGTGTAARFNYPNAIVADLDGNLYVAELLGQVVRKVTPAAVVTTVVGTPGVIGFVPGPLPGVLQYPGGLALRGSDLYIAMDTGIGIVLNRP